MSNDMRKLTESLNRIAESRVFPELDGIIHNLKNAGYKNAAAALYDKMVMTNSTRLPFGFTNAYKLSRRDDQGNMFYVMFPNGEGGAFRSLIDDLDHEIENS